jgi:hypothetical protein
MVRFTITPYIYFTFMDWRLTNISFDVKTIREPPTYTSPYKANEHTL